MNAIDPAPLETPQSIPVEPSPGVFFVIVVLACVAAALAIFLRGVALALVVLAIDGLYAVQARFAGTLLRLVPRARRQLHTKGPY